jgi:nucleolar complex protein 2
LTSRSPSLFTVVLELRGLAISLIDENKMSKTKSTKKFEKRHLKDTLLRRKEGAKIKQKHQVKAKQKARRAKERGAEHDSDEDNDKNGAANGNAFENMTVDQFFAGGFEIPERGKKKRKRGAPGDKDNTAKKAKLSDEEEESGEDSGESESDADEVENAGGAVDIGADGLSEASDEDEGDHKEQLESLAKKDPEFYRYLKENDAELLDFEVGDFEEIDELSGDEKPAKSKGKKEEEDEKLNPAVVERWEQSLATKHSLRALRELVLAFRAASHLNDGVDGKSYKYTITNSEGTNHFTIFCSC